MEPLAQRRILFIFSAAAIRLTSGRMLPFSSHVCVFYFNEIANRERSESCYITFRTAAHVVLSLEPSMKTYRMVLEDTVMSFCFGEFIQF